MERKKGEKQTKKKKKTTKNRARTLQILAKQGWSHSYSFAELQPAKNLLSITHRYNADLKNVKITSKAQPKVGQE